MPDWTENLIDWNTRSRAFERIARGRTQRGRHRDERGRRHRRRTLGATSRDVIQLVAGSAARVLAAGAVVGLALSTVLGRLLATMLFRVGPMDSMTYALVALVLAVTAAVATAVPAWRATRIAPAVALRAQ